MQTDFWAALQHSSLDGLDPRACIYSPTHFFFLGCKASFHRWLERLDAHLVVRWFRLSMVLALSLLAVGIALAFVGGADGALSGKLSLLMSHLRLFIGWGVMAYLLLWFQRHEQRFGQWLATAGLDSL